MKISPDFGNKLYSEIFVRRKIIDFATFLISLIFLDIIYLYKQFADSLDVTIIYYISFGILLPILIIFLLWDLATTKVVLYENGIYGNQSLKSRGIWHFRDIEDIYVKPYPYGKKMKQIVILLKNGEEKTVMAYDREDIIERFYEEAKKAFENYKEKFENP